MDLECKEGVIEWEKMVVKWGRIVWIKRVCLQDYILY